ncbi:hypothetical protein CcaverHIS002_0208960 [Cutaneotrichosporon cavernicola]|uniref:Major facilitator superfamily (MFS) profile domain-containing protein n=1 Tax=Cutaneotrichosporon cavernicola TaxID=279322 RepID=A0AA48I9F7_9TREE|nr:uncharacterized protein CcaverHIS019_0208970 [Cutaneotrichosporon cavernicola]BEI81736.1 hypothetical protein CcaverHIS002_0208960 [Cutaneotrichosporon cavernicola]BEI89535.1 hypothetical protein CcaverHIS019_0208970 [Cutaneotrichosporon cavernicola]BEI97308.1 hypothetical protein CcaverHIS631_0208970 [Cutaneotrichosporon cavernicola]BEJ05082.1 hypothetical protein CcaverHIS641_0208990 [Cutaneotrichosporon cavernicola]
MASTPSANFVVGAGTPEVTQHAAAEVETDKRRNDVESTLDTPIETAFELSQGTVSDGLSRTDTRVSFEQPIGVTKIESLYMVFGKGWKLFFLWLSIALVAYVWSLAVITTAIYAAFATSFWGKHTIIGLIAVINNLISAVIMPILAKVCDIMSRPAGLFISAAFFTIGYIIVAAAPTIHAVVGGEAIYTAGRTGTYQVMHILISDMTPLRWRGVVLGCYSLPFVLNGFVAGLITADIRALSMDNGQGWRWGFGMFAIIVPAAVGPAIVVMFWGHHRAKKLGALSLASSSYTRRRILEGESAAPQRTWKETAIWIFWEGDVIGLILFAFAFGLILAPPTLEPITNGGYKAASLIAMFVVGGLVFIAFLVWETTYARSPICPRRLLNPTFLSCLAVSFFHFFSGQLTDAYYNSWAYIVKPEWSDRNYTFFSNIHNTGLCLFATIAGFLLYWTKRYKYIQLAGIAIRIIGEGLNYMTWQSNHQSDAMLIVAKTIISMGAGFIMTTTAVAAPATVPHRDLAVAMAVLHMVPQLGGSFAGSISASVWNSQVPANLKRYLPELSDKERANVFGFIRRARRQEPHDLVNRAYSEAMRPLFIAAIVSSCVAFIISLFAKEMELNSNHNNVEKHKEIYLRNKDEVTDEAILEKVEAAENKARIEMSNKGQ